MTFLRPTPSLRSLATLLLLITTTVQAQKPHTIWFFGNSYLRFNGLIGFARCYYSLYTQRLNPPVYTIHTPNYTPGGATLGNHLAFLRDDPGSPAFDFDWEDFPWVVLQEQSVRPSIPAYLEQTIQWAQDLSFYFWLSRVQDVMFVQTWGAKTGHRDSQVNYPDFVSHNQALFRGYQQIVEATSTPALPRYMAPCGLVYETIYNDCVEAGLNPQDPEVCIFPKLFTNDGRHPSRLGAYLCGTTIGTSMTGIHPDETTCLPNQGDPVDHGEAYIVRMAVAKTIEQTFTSGDIVYKFDTLWPTPAPTTAAPTTAPIATAAPTITEPAPLLTTLAPTDEEFYNATADEISILEFTSAPSLQDLTSVVEKSGSDETESESSTPKYTNIQDPSTTTAGGDGELKTQINYLLASSGANSRRTLVSACGSAMMAAVAATMLLLA